jgi:hypothetical protein
MFIQTAGYSHKSSPLDDLDASAIIVLATPLSGFKIGLQAGDGIGG